MTEPGEREGHGLITQRPPAAVEYVLPYEDEEGVAVSPVSFLNTLLRHRRLVVGWVFVCGGTAGLLMALLRGYRAESSFAPQVNQTSASSLAGLASQFGFNVASLTGGPTLDFYASVANSRAILTKVAEATYSFVPQEGESDSVSGTLVQILNLRGATSLERLQRTVKKLDHMVTVTKDEDAGIVTIEVSAKWSPLAEQINRKVLSLVNDVSLSQHQAQASAERTFTIGRLQEARGQLDSAENALQAFLEKNRTYQDSPRLTVEAGRLQRRVDFLQQVYLTLAQAYERATIEEARNTPVITVIDLPEGSGHRPGSLALGVVVGLIVGGVVGALHGIVRDYMKRQRTAESPTYSEFVTLRANALRDLTALPRRLAAIARLGRRS